MTMRTIQRNSKGAAVEDVQKRLRVLGYSLNVDGVYPVSYTHLTLPTKA